MPRGRESSEKWEERAKKNLSADDISPGVFDGSKI